MIEFKHTAYSRTVFGKGAVEAAKFLAGKPAGRYDMSDVSSVSRGTAEYKTFRPGGYYERQLEETLSGKTFSTVSDHCKGIHRNY